MTNPTLAAEFPWLRREPAPILGDSRPRSIKELLGKSRLWLDLYRDWLQSYNASYVDGLNYLTGSKAQQVEYGRRLSDAYPGFYAAAGALKDWVKKAGRGADASAQFPWVSGDPGRLVGDARPKDFEALVELGQKSDWMTLFRGWLAHEQPFDHAENWLDWVLEQGSGGESWQQALDPTVEAFAHDIGRLKDRLRETHGNAAERVGDAAERPGPVEGQPGGTQDRPGTGASGRPEARAGAQHGGGQAGAQHGGGQGGAQHGGGQAAGAARPGAGQQAAARPGATQPAAAAPRERSTASHQVEGLVHTATPLVAKATELSRWVSWLAQRFAVCGGQLAEEANNLRGYQQLLDRDGPYVNQQGIAVRNALTHEDGVLFEQLAGLRNAVYGLAWDVDLGYPNYYGGWPHHRLSVVGNAVNDAGSPTLCHEAGLVLGHLTEGLDSVYAMASALLDVALEVISTQIPGYEGEDSAEPWGTHEVTGARTELSGVAQLAAALAAHEPDDDEDQADLDQACRASFGIPYLNLNQLAGVFR